MHIATPSRIYKMLNHKKFGEQWRAPTVGSNCSQVTTTDSCPTKQGAQCQKKMGKTLDLDFLQCHRLWVAVFEHLQSWKCSNVVFVVASTEGSSTQVIQRNCEYQPLFIFYAWLGFIKHMFLRRGNIYSVYSTGVGWRTMENGGNNSPQICGKHLFSQLGERRMLNQKRTEPTLFKCKWWLQVS